MIHEIKFTDAMNLGNFSHEINEQESKVTIHVNVIHDKTLRWNQSIGMVKSIYRHGEINLQG